MQAKYARVSDKRDPAFSGCFKCQLDNASYSTPDSFFCIIARLICHGYCYFNLKMPHRLARTIDSVVLRAFVKETQSSYIREPLSWFQTIHPGARRHPVWIADWVWML